MKRRKKKLYSRRLGRCAKPCRVGEGVPPRRYSRWIKAGALTGETLRAIALGVGHMSSEKPVGHFEVEVKLNDKIVGLKAFANLKIKLDVGYIIVKDFAIRVGKDGDLWVSAPSKKGKDEKGNEKYYETVHMLSKEGRANLHAVILGAYRAKTGEPASVKPAEEEGTSFV